jgi:hypothetical protein
VSAPTPVGLASSLDVIVASTDQLYLMDALGPALQRIGLQRNVRLTDVPATAFRYAVPGDREEAFRIASLLRGRCFPELVPELARNTELKPRQFELRLAKGVPIPGPAEFATSRCAAPVRGESPRALP